MEILQVLNGIPYIVLQGEPKGIEILDIADHTAVVTGQCLFICITDDGTAAARYLKEAEEKGAACAIVPVVPDILPERLVVLQVKRLRQLAGRIAAQYLKWPSQHMHVIGVTGTNGKTSTTALLHHILTCRGVNAGLLGTIENCINGNCESTENTTLPAVPLQKLLNRMRGGGTKAVVMEVSSHALDQDRVGGIIYETAIFTNLTQDHLDYHKTMDRYAMAKGKLFQYCRKALLNGDDPRWKQYAEMASGSVYTYGMGSHVDFRARNIEMDLHGLRFQWSFRGESLGWLQYPSPGRFQVYNVLAAAAAAWLEGITPDDIVRALDVEQPLVRGRFQELKSLDGITVIVDYAHTPDGLKQVLRSCKELVTGRVITVFGCGGNRDRGKRPLMGEIAGEYSDIVVITSDNPRDEDPIQIMQEIRQGIKKQVSCEMIANRTEAIQYAIQTAQASDLVLIAGKGHETVQWIRGRKVALDDIQCAKAALEKRNSTIV